MVKRFRFKLLLLVLSFCTVSLHGQSPIPTDQALLNDYPAATWNKAAVQRLADIARLWGVIKYFHPQMLKGRLDPDRLVLDHIDPLLIDPSAQNFTMTVNRMLAMLHDPGSRVVSNDSAKYTFYKILSAKAFPGSITFVSASQNLFAKGYTLDSSLISKPSAHQNYIVDLRNDAFNEQLGLAQYQNFVQPLVAGLISRMLVLPAIRTAYYHALLREDFRDDLDAIPSSDRAGDPNYWYQERFGLKNTSQGAYVLPADKPRYQEKKFCFLVNQYDDANTLKALFALKNRNQCSLIFDGPVPDYLLGDYYNMPLSDGITVKVKVAEQIYEDGSLGAGPDFILSYSAPGSPILIRAAVSCFTHPAPFHRKPAQNTVLIRLPQKAYPENLYPEAKLRLLGLFNFWNVIHYFYPNKNLISGSWDEALTYFVPRFLFAKDYKSYYWLLREISARLNDGHAEVLRNNVFLPPAGISGYYAPFCAEYLEGKTIIVKLVPGPDHAPLADKLEIGDQITAIDDVPIGELYQQWARFIGITNEVNYYRTLHKLPLLSRSGPAPFRLSIVRNHQAKMVTVKPVEKEVYLPTFYSAYYPEIMKPYWKILNDSTGYVRVNSIYSNQADSVWQMLKDKKYIILDARGYPRDEQIVKSVAGPFMTRADTVCINAFPEISSPVLSRNAVTLEPEIVTPPTTHVIVPGNKKFILLCAAGNGSQAETNIISWQAILHPITIGTTTVGANGVSNTILMPGGYAAHYSGFAVYYKDGTPNQHLGVKIDIPVSITIQGELGSQDEILQKALQYICGSK